MDIKNPDNFRYKRFNIVQSTKSHRYDYAKEGILTKCLPKILFKGNSVFVTFLQLIDLRLIMAAKYIDRLKTFKFISEKY